MSPTRLTWLWNTNGLIAPAMIISRYPQRETRLPFIRYELPITLLRIVLIVRSNRKPRRGKFVATWARNSNLKNDKQRPLEPQGSPTQTVQCPAQLEEILFSVFAECGLREGIRISTFIVGSVFMGGGKIRESCSILW